MGDLMRALSLAIEIEEIQRILREFKNSDSYNSIIELYNSIWRMTYENSSAIGIQEISKGSISHKILLMNEQEDLIPTDLVPIKEVESLDLGGFPEAVLFPELLRYTNLKRLYLWENSLTELPGSFFKLTSLQSLYVNDDLVDLSVHIGNLSNLVSLDLSGNQLVGLPNQLASLKMLKSLNLKDNLIEQFSLDLSSMKSIQKIDLSNNSKNLIIDSSVLEECQKRNIELIY